MSLAFFSPPPHCPSPFLSSSHIPSYHHPPTASFSATGTGTATGTGSVVVVAATASSSHSSNSNSNSIHNQKVSQSAIQRISDKLRRLGYVPPATDSIGSSSSRETDTERASSSPGEIFIPTPHRLPAYRLSSTLEQQQIPRNEKKEAAPSVTELMVPPHELRRLRTLGIRLRTKIKIGKPGVTEGIVNGIHERWRRSEVVKIKCDDLCRINMRRTHDILEIKTGGIVVWRSGSIIVLYRGPDYRYPYFRIPRQVAEQSNVADGSKPDNAAAAPAALIPGVGSRNLVRLQLPGEAKLAEEADRLLDGLGPRFSDWWGLDPKPVDGDLLPGVVVGFRKPFRVLPFGIKQRLTDSEMTTLRRLGRPLPCHFALGRNRNLQGLAQAMIKLWEKCEIAKIAIKRGVPDADSDTMIEELKKLTGGTLLSRDSECIVFYRGKDFLPLAVSTAIEERRKNVNNSATVQEESHDERRISDHDSVYKETFFSDNHEQQMDSVVINKLEKELSLAIRKKEKAEKLLEELENSSGPPREGHEKEAISEEERYMLRKVGLSMKAFLLMGRKGVFDGTVENMHLHWKYRELVKVICKEKDIKEVEHVARILESESGGILVAVERVSKGYAIIIYRGKNYQRPKTLRPKSLPSKREAMKRSLQAQRRQSLKLHVLSLARNIEKLKRLMDKDESSSSPAIQKSSSYMEDSEGPTSSGNSEAEDSEESSEDDIEDSYEAPSLSVGEEVSVTNSKLVTNIQPTDIQPAGDVYPTSGASSIDEKHSSEADTDEVPFKPAPLSNKERLVLRKQALRMRNRPVLAVGRNNVITGVAKTIKTHFQKYPLAIVNIKNRADGTSVQQLISELEEATGSIMVSREPNKVILYRGWQHGGNPVDKKKEDDHPTKSSKENKDTISPELMEAIRVECGFHPSQEEG